jgi:atypical dual specificity phosphatase
VIPNAFDWLLPGQLAACVNPALLASVVDDLRAQGIGLLINLHDEPDAPELLARLHAEGLHLPVADFTPPSQVQLQQGVAAIDAALGRGVRVAVHCGGGLGRTGTLLAAFLVSHGADADAAIARVREARPGSVETREQEAAVCEFARQSSA